MATMKNLNVKFQSPKLMRLIPTFKRKPVFNSPVNLERKYQISRALFILFLSLLISLSIAIIALKAMTLKFIENNLDTGFDFETDDPNPTVLAALPGKLYVAPAKIAIATAAISLSVGIGHGVLVVKNWKEGVQTQAYSFRRNSMFLHLTNTILVLFSVISIYTTHKMASHFSPNYVDFKSDHATPTEGVRYNIGTFDLESWSCQLQSEPGAMMVWMDYAAQCKIEVAGREVMIPFMVVSGVLAGLCIWGMLGGKRNVDGERMETEDVGLEMGKFNAI